MRYRPSKVLVLGDLLVDFWAYTTTRDANPEGAAMIACGTAADRSATLGGAGLVASLLKSMALRVKVMGRLGQDVAGATAHTLLHEFGLSCKNIAFRDEHVTPAKMRFVNESGAVVFRYDEERHTDDYIDDPHSDFNFDLFVRHAQFADCVVIADYGKGYCHREAAKIIEAAKYYGALTVVGVKPFLLDQYAGADIVKLNAAEAAHYLELNDVAPSPDRHELVNDVARLCGAQAVFVTAARNGAVFAVRGANGSYTVHHEAAKPCFPYISNCVGAGDAYLAGLVAEFLLPPRLADRRRGGKPLAPARLQTGAAAAAASAAQYLTRGFPEVDAATPFLASWDKRAQLSTGNKIVPLEGAQALCQAWRSVGDAIVFTNGCFDLLHRGHVHLLEQAKQQGKRLVVAVNSDASVRLLKGAARPVQDFETRAKVVASIGCVDAVVQLDEYDLATQPTLRAMVTEFVPDVLVKGAQYKEEEIVGWEEMVNRGSPGRIWRCPMVDNCSTTQTVSKVQNDGK
jgi:D-beta-D-heptose 7-phosphate kinase/D-beta-D-heptose 1-phosphate adenosyltransferase